MATIRKRGDKWQVQVRRKGCPAVSRSFLLKSDAEAWARQTEVEADRRGLPVDTRVLDRMTVRALIMRYRDEIAAHKRGAEAETALLNALLGHPLASRPLSSVSAAIFTAYRDARLKTVKPATVVREFGIYQHMFEVAIKDWGIPVPSNPLKGVRRPGGAKARDRRIKGTDELEALLTSANECRNKLIRPLFLFAIETGMRRSEIINARWADIDIAKRTLHIPITKNGHPRTIPLTTRAASILAELPRDDERVFPVSANAVRLAWRRLRERAKADGLRFHDLRHEAVSRFFEKGLTVPEVALISGHRDMRMLFRYTHLKAEDVAAKLD